MKLKIEVLTPLHIGSGEEFNQLEYFLSNLTNRKRINIIDFGDVLGLILKYVKFEDLNDFKDYILTYLNQNISNTKFTGDILSLLKSLKGKFITEEQYASIINKELLKKRKFFYTVPKDVKKEDLGTKISGYILNKDINGTFRPYIPGSSLKGAIVSAFYYHLLKKKSKEKYIHLKDLIKKLYSKRKKGNELKRISNEIKKIHLFNNYEKTLMENLSQKIIIRDFYFDDDVLFMPFRIERLFKNTKTGKKDPRFNVALFVLPPAEAIGEIILKEDFFSVYKNIYNEHFTEDIFFKLVNDFYSVVSDYIDNELSIQYKNLNGNSSILQLGKFGGYYTKTLGILWFEENDNFPKTFATVRYKNKNVIPGIVKLTKRD